LVNSRKLHELVVGHCRANPSDLRPEGVLRHQVPCELETVRFAPLVNALGEVLDEKFRHRSQVIVPDFLPVATVQIDFVKQARQMGHQVVASPVEKLAGKLFRPTIGLSVATRFVGENSRNGFAELLCEPLAVSVMGDTDEGFNGFGVHDINVAVALNEELNDDFASVFAHVQSLSRHFLPLKPLSPLAGDDIDGEAAVMWDEFSHVPINRDFADAEQLLVVVTATTRDKPAGKPARPFVLVVEPR
jgi:hypothetical protein